MLWEDMDVVVGVHDNPDRVGCEHRGNVPYSTDAVRDKVISTAAERCGEIVLLEDCEWFKST